MLHKSHGWLQPSSGKREGWLVNFQRQYQRKSRSRTTNGNMQVMQTFQEKINKRNNTINNSNNKHMQWYKYCQKKNKKKDCLLSFTVQDAPTILTRKCLHVLQDIYPSTNASPPQMTDHYTASRVLFPPSLPMQTLPPHLRWLLVHGSVWWTPLCCGAHHQTWLTQSQSVGHLSSSQHECLVSEDVKTQRTREVGKNWVWLANTDMVIINWLIEEAGLCSPFLHHRRCRSLNWWKGCSLVWGLCVSILCDEGLRKEGSVTMSCVLIT